jgi:hypothetical protein
MTAEPTQPEVQEPSEKPSADAKKPIDRSRAHIVEWDWDFNRPIVDGKIQNPITGEIQEAGKIHKDGPPSVKVALFNMNPAQRMRSMHSDHAVAMETIYLGIGKLMRDGIIKLVSVNASEYSFTGVCEVLVTDEEFSEAYRRFPATPEELSGTFGMLRV